MKSCGACREFRDNLKSARSRLRALVPPIGLGPLAGVLHLIGGGAAVGSKVAVTAGCCALLAGGAATTLVVAQGSGKVAGTERVEREQASGAQAGGRTLIGKPIRTGTKLPRSVAISTVQVRLNAGEPRKRKRLVRVSCPAGMRGAGLATLRTAAGEKTHRLLRAYQYSDRDMDLLERDTGRRTVSIRYAAAPNLPAPALVTVGTLCKRR